MQCTLVQGLDEWRHQSSLFPIWCSELHRAASVRGQRHVMRTVQLLYFVVSALRLRTRKPSKFITFFLSDDFFTLLYPLDHRSQTKPLCCPFPL